MPSHQMQTPWRIAPVWWKWIKRSLWAGAILYVLLGTYVWIFLYGLFIVVFVPDMPQSEFMKTAWCKSGDWVIDTFQPMVSDARLIKHLNENREEMLIAAAMVNDRTDVKIGFGLTPEFKALLKRIDMESVANSYPWPTDPYSVKRAQDVDQCARENKGLKARLQECFKERRSVVKFVPDFGRNWAQHFCTHSRTSLKGYLYFPGVVPRVENGELLGLVDSSGSPEPLAKVVPNADANSDGGSIVRQIDAHWFISRQ